jgi:hypothetical protein
MGVAGLICIQTERNHSRRRCFMALPVLAVILRETRSAYGPAAIGIGFFANEATLTKSAQPSQSESPALAQEHYYRSY